MIDYSIDCSIAPPRLNMPLLNVLPNGLPGAHTGPGEERHQPCQFLLSTL
jgi:hypothetical protein